MANAQDYTALGPTHVGFRTHGARIEKGAELTGTQIGVDAKGGTPEAEGTGVAGEGNHGVEGIGTGDGAIGVSGYTRSDAGTNCIGVMGYSFTPGGIGVTADGQEIGIRGSGTRGGMFSGPAEGADGAPINLVPVLAEVPAQERLPETGKAGDLFVLNARPSPDDHRFPGGEDQFVAQLWFCLRDGNPHDPAIWGRVQFSEFKP